MLDLHGSPSASESGDDSAGKNRADAGNFLELFAGGGVQIIGFVVFASLIGT